MPPLKPGAGVVGAEPPPEAERDFGDVFRAEAPRLQRFFDRQLRDHETAQDLTQETLIRFLKSGGTDRVINPEAFLQRIATNLLRDWFVHSSTKLSRASVPILEGLDAMDLVDQHQTVAGRQELNEWEAILEKLKPVTLEIFLLSRVDNFTYDQIAKHLNITVRMVKRHMQKAIAHVDSYRSDR